jgi:hypothetical protein
MKIGWSFGTNTRMIVIKNKNAGVIRIYCTTDSRVTGTQVTIINILWNNLSFVRYGLAAPWTILPVRSNYDPLFSKWMPTFLPDATA